MALLTANDLNGMNWNETICHVPKKSIQLFKWHQFLNDESAVYGFALVKFVPFCKQQYVDSIWFKEILSIHFDSFRIDGKKTLNWWCCSCRIPCNFYAFHSNDANKHKISNANKIIFIWISIFRFIAKIIFKQNN